MQMNTFMFIQEIGQTLAGSLNHNDIDFALIQRKVLPHLMENSQ